MSHLTEEKRRIINLYGPGGMWSNWAQNRPESEINLRANSAIDVIINKLNLPRNSQDKINILSPSANRGRVEEVMTKQLPPDYLLFVGDLAKLEPRNGLITYYRGDAEYLPLKPKSFSLIYDFKGALWHQALDWEHALLTQFEQYERVLLDKGIVLIDGGTKLLIGPQLDKLQLKKIPGFSIPEKYFVMKDNIIEGEMYAYTKE